MATITVNFDSIDGPSKEFTTCDIDWTSFSAMPAFHNALQVTQPVNGIEGNVTSILFYQSNGDFGSAFSWLPNTETDNNTLNKYANTYTLVGSPVSEWHSDFAANPSNYAELEIGTMPTDWGSNPHYMRLINSPSSLDDKRVECFSPVSMNETWNMNEQYYLDETGELVNLIYLKNGYNFATSKGIIAPSSMASSYKGSLVGGAYTFEPFVNNDPYNKWRTNYVFTYPAAISPISPIAYSNPENYPNYQFQSRSAWHGTNLQTIASPTIVFNVFISTIISDTQYVGLASIVYNTETGKYTDIGGFLFSENFWEGSIIDPQNESLWGDDGPVSIHQGGQGTFTAPSDNDGNRDGTSVQTQVNFFNSANNFLDGGYNFYVMGQGETAPFTEMMAQLWDPTIFQSYENMMQNPLNAIISCYTAPAALSPIKSQSTKTIQAAGAELSDTAAPLFKDTMLWYHVGSVNVSDYTDSFADYTATNVFINLPYVGTYKLDTEALMEGVIGVDYVVDAYTGDITARVWTQDRFGNKKYRYEFKGNCAKQIPLASIVGTGAQRIRAITELLFTLGANAGIQAMADNASSYYGSGGSGIGGLLWTAEEASPGFKAGTIGTIVASGIIKAANSSANITQSNASGGSVTSLVEDQCFLLITRPQWSAPSDYGKLFGYPSDCSGTIREKFHGFLSVRSIRLESVPGTPAEKAEIEQLMRTGVFVDNIFGPEE